MSDVPSLPSRSVSWRRQPLVWLALLIGFIVIVTLVAFFGSGSTFLGARLTGPDRSAPYLLPLVLHTGSDGLICYDKGQNSCKNSFSTTKVRTIALLFGDAPVGLESTALGWCKKSSLKGLVTAWSDCDGSPSFWLGFVAKTDDFEASTPLAYCSTNGQLVVGSEPCLGGSRQELGYVTMATAPLLTHEAYLCDALRLNNQSLYQQISLCTTSPGPSFPPVPLPQATFAPASLQFFNSNSEPDTAVTTIPTDEPSPTEEPTSTPELETPEPTEELTEELTEESLDTNTETPTDEPSPTDESFPTDE